MLIIQREKEQSIMIGDDIEIIVLHFQANRKVRLGIICPKDSPVHRKEVYEIIKKEQAQPPAGDKK